MAAPVFGSSALQWVGTAPEAVYGTPAAVPVWYHPADTPVWTTPTENLDDKALRGLMGVNYQRLKGLRFDQVTFKSYLYLDSIFPLIRSALGIPDVISGTPTGTGSTTSSGSTVAGATTINGAATIPTGTWVQIDTGALAEIRQITTSGTVFTVTALTYAHASGVAIVPVVSANGYSHKTSLQSGNNGQPAGTTVFFYDALGKAWQMAGSQISDLKITINTGALATVEVTYIGLPAVPITPPTNTPTTAKPMPSWNTVFTIASTAYLKYSQVVIDIKRDTKMIPTVTASQSPFAIFAGPLAVTATFDGVYQGSTDNDLAANFANTQPAFTAKIAPAGDAVNSLTLQSTVVAYDDVKLAGGTDWQTVSSTLTMQMNSTDVAAGGGQSPILATLVSPVSTLI